jgi:hypothetical protein
MKRAMIIICAIFLALVFFDIFTTYLIMHQDDGVGIEANPIMANILDNYGLILPLALKIIISFCLCIWVIKITTETTKIYIPIVLTGVLSIYAFLLLKYNALIIKFWVILNWPSS